MSKNYSFINWHEGMYLMPEHFKENDKIQDKRRSYILKNFINFFYGVNKLIINENLIAEGIINIVEFEGIMPNGEILQINKNEDIEINFSNRMKKDQDLTVYLCISYDNNDFNIEKYNSIQIPKLSPKKIIIMSSTKPAYISMPIAKITKKNGVFALANYIPPQIKFTKDISVFKEYKNLILKIKQKIIYLTKKINNSTFDEYDKIIANYIKIKQSLISQYFLLNQVLDLENIQPYKVFKYLVSFLSSIITLDKDGSVFDIKYNHYNIFNVFLNLYEKIYKCLDNIKEDYKEVQAIKNEDEFLFFISNKIQEVIIEFKFDKNITRDEMLNWINSSIISSRSKFLLACDNRVLGIDREIITKSQEMQITNSINGVMCKVNINSDYFLFDEDLIIYNPSKNKTSPITAIFYQVI